MRGDAGAGRIAERHHTVEGANGGQAQVARDDAVTTVLLEAIEKAENNPGVQAGHG
jgi:hypothetical protein